MIPTEHSRSLRDVPRDLAAVAEEDLHRTPDAERVHAGHAMLLAEHPANTPGHRCHLAWSECSSGVDGTVTPCDMYIEKLAIVPERSGIGPGSEHASPA